MVLTTIRLSRPGLSPPVYLAGTFTQWEPTVEMDHGAISGSRDQHEFSKVVDVEAGEHQFKFRLGHGDWWIVDESAPTATDAFGNVNNVIQVAESEEVGSKVEEVKEKSVPVPVKEVQAVPVKEVPAAPVKEDKPVRQVLSKSTLSSQKVPTLEPAVAADKDASSVQAILREPSVETPREQEPVVEKQAVEAAPTVNGTAKVNGVHKKDDKPVQAKTPSKSFISKLLSCFSGKAAFGMVTVSAMLVAVYIRR